MTVREVDAVATARNLAAMAARAYRLRTTSAHLVPPDGPVILAAAHSALLDGFFLVAASPRPVRVLVDAGAFVPPFRRVLNASGQIPYDASHPDLAALRSAAAVLRAGGAVGIFPEGQRGDGDVRHVHADTAYLAATTGARVVPVAILGARPAGGRRDALPWLRARIDVVFGEPVDVRVEGDPYRRIVLMRSGERVRQFMSDHVRAACDRTGQSLPGPFPDRAAPTSRSHE